MAKAENKIEKKNIKKDKKQQSTTKNNVEDKALHKVVKKTEFKKDKPSKIKKIDGKKVVENGDISVKKSNKKKNIGNKNVESNFDVAVEKSNKKKKIDNKNVESNFDVAVEKSNKKKKINNKKVVENGNISGEKTNKKKKKEVKKEENSEGDNSVFAVTERLLKNKNAKKEQKKIEGKKESELKKKNNDKLESINKFFEDNKEVQKEKGKNKPNWFDGKVKSVVMVYLQSVENHKNDSSKDNELTMKQNMKKLYRFFYKLAKQMGEDISIVKSWYHSTKQGILKSGSIQSDLENKSILTVKILNRTVRAISKETTVSPVAKTDDVPAWFDEEFAAMLKARQKAKALFKSKPTEENQKAYREAFKLVKKELKSRKKSKFVSPKPYVKKASQPKPKNFGQKKKTFGKPSGQKPTNNKFGSTNTNNSFNKNNTPFNKTSSFTPNKKHIKFDD